MEPKSPHSCIRIPAWDRQRSARSGQIAMKSCIETGDLRDFRKPALKGLDQCNLKRQVSQVERLRPAKLLDKFTRNNWCSFNRTPPCTTR